MLFSLGREETSIRTPKKGEGEDFYKTELNAISSTKRGKMKRRANVELSGTGGGSPWAKGKGAVYGVSRMTH